MRYRLDILKNRNKRKRKSKINRKEEISTMGSRQNIITKSYYFRFKSLWYFVKNLKKRNHLFCVHFLPILILKKHYVNSNEVYQRIAFAYL